MAPVISIPRTPYPINISIPSATYPAGTKQEKPTWLAMAMGRCGDQGACHLTSSSRFCPQEKTPHSQPDQSGKKRTVCTNAVSRERRLPP